MLDTLSLVRRAALSVAALCGFSLLLTGCGTPVTLSGNVNFNGAALPEGHLRLDADGGGASSAKAKIVAGKFTVPVSEGLKPGRYRASITATRKTGKMIARQERLSGGEAKQIEQIEQYIPERYNRQSELSVDVVAGDNTKDFNLEGPKSP